jgi:hypothetical protein
MRAALLVTALILSAFIASPADASVGYTCNAKDANARLAIGAAYGTSIGSGIANFGGEIENFDKTVPERVRRVSLDLDHISQGWFRGRDIKFAARWQSPDDEPFAEVVLIVETRRGEAEEDPYVGNYQLTVYAAPPESGGEWTTFEASGDVTCTVG